MGRCDRLKWNRKKMGMTQQDLANKIGVSVATISKLESDETAWNTVRYATDDAISSMLRDLGSWQCDLESVFNKYASKDVKDVKDEKINAGELRRLVKKKTFSFWYDSRRPWKVRWCA